MPKNDDVESSQPFNLQFFQKQVKETNYRTTGPIPGPNKVISGPREKESSEPIEIKDKNLFIDPVQFRFRANIVNRLRRGESIEETILDARDKQFKR